MRAVINLKGVECLTLLYMRYLFVLISSATSARAAPAFCITVWEHFFRWTAVCEVIEPSLSLSKVVFSKMHVQNILHLFRGVRRRCIDLHMYCTMGNCGCAGRGGLKRGVRWMEKRPWKIKVFFLIKKSADLYVVAVVGVERDVTEL